MFLAHKSDAHNFSDRGLPKALSTLVYPTHRTTCLPFGSSGGLSPLSHLSVPNISPYPHFPTIKLRLKCHKIAKFKKKKKNWAMIQQPGHKRASNQTLPSPDTQAVHQDHGENNYCSPCPILFQGLFLITVLHPPPRHTRMGTVQGQMATDGASEVPLQI